MTWAADQPENDFRRPQSPLEDVENSIPEMFKTANLTQAGVFG